MYLEKVTTSDFFRVTWNDFDRYAKRIASEIQAFCEETGTKIDFICPIVRGGTVLATYLSHLLRVIPCIGIQYKHLNVSDDYQPPELIWEGFSYFSDEKRDETEYVALVVEGNHCSGTTARITCDFLKKHFKKIKIIYVSIARDYLHKDVIDDAIFSTTGFYSNESKEPFTPEFYRKHGIMEKMAVFPWEILQEEMDECNLVPMIIETSLIG